MTSLGLALVAAGVTYLMYMASPLAAVGAVLGSAVGCVVLWRPIYGVYAALLAVPLEVFQIHVPLVSSVTVAEVLFLLTGISGALHLMVEPGWRPAPVHLAFLGLIVVSLTGFLFAHDTAVITRITRVWLAYFFMSIVVSRGTRRELELALLALASSGAVVAIAAILNTGSQTVEDTGALVAGRASTGFAHPNVLAFFLIMSMPQAIVLAARGTALRRLAMAGASALIFAGLLLTLSRSALIGGAVSLLVLLAWPRFRRAVGVGLLIGGLIVAVNFSSIQNAPEVSVLSKRLSTVNAAGLQRDPRIPIWQATPGLIARHPLFGVGEGNFPNVAQQLDLLDPSNDLPYDHAHDIFLTFAVELGLVGLAVFCAWVFLIGRLLWANIRERDPDWPLKLGLMAALVGMLITSITEYPPRTNVIMATLLVLIGILVGFERHARADADQNTAVDRG